jgi:hypothetical protein
MWSRDVTFEMEDENRLQAFDMWVWRRKKNV